MKTFKYLLFLLLIIVIGFCVYIAVQPNNFEVSRTRTINAPAEVIYNNVIDFKNWPLWLSWQETNPDLELSLSNETKGIDGTLFWENYNDSGTLKTIAANPFSEIQETLEASNFPTSALHWTFTANNDGTTNVTWSISANNLSFKFKMNTVLMHNLEQELGTQYERSLEKLDSMVVTNMKKYSIEINGITEHGGGFYMYSTASSKIENLRDSIETLMQRVTEYADNNHITISGFPFVNYHSYDTENDAVMFSCCIPTTSKVITTQPDILTGKLNPFKTLKTTLKGDYSNLKEAWEMSMTYITNSGNTVAENGPMLEVYVNNSNSIPNPANLKTEIYIALKD